MQGINNTKK